MRYRRFVALGDSTTEGLMDPLPDGSGFRGWADRLAEILAAIDPELRYANLAVRGKLARQIRETQLDDALALEPDLVSLLAGLNDMLRRNVDVAGVAAEIDGMVSRLREAGADVILFTLPDPVPINPLAKTAAGAIAQLNDAIREISQRRGTFIVELDVHPVSSDRRLWNEDRLHANPEGHRRIALAVAHAMGLPDTDLSWAAGFPSPLGRRSSVSHVVWFGRYFTPWVIRRLRGRSSGDGRVAKRPELEPFT
ncbi:SGNH/GDSL hydrolase family protein [Solirubrobacter ginsenosidimutans]|uniref:SGNH/GDSL hydrolase family protein n=1 Tax=Solirubrobacter ginsenosidimutans TaxID=490573 RepID=A0A9X3MT12_9ACTN|nr:SGNH/GDSL hydrolase family protein [Solirubrobacter ginsenosidimutans]MDA0160698.1 SGNH/GDSL hydrolase family protein [Solirubrobacter ginsenosidimutans]